jgi:Domain of Unknown Function (DUF1080)
MKTIKIAIVTLAIVGCSPATTPKSKPIDSAAQEMPVAKEQAVATAALKRLEELDRLARLNAQNKPDDDKLVDAKPETAKPDLQKDNTIVLFDGTSLKNWKATNFGGEGEVRVENGLLVFDTGTPLTGVTWTGPELPKTNYEVTLEAKLIAGNDFFCGIGFPVGKMTASFVAGGWGGALCGISMLDGDAAADNDSGIHRTFKKDQWYKFCLRVRPEKIEVWLDDEQIIDVQIKDRKVEIHPAMEPSLPFGLACYETKVAYRNVKLKKLE